jgi:hypothetical protein
VRAEPELDEGVLEPAQIEGGDLTVAPQLLYGDLILTAYEHRAKCEQQLEPVRTGAKVSTGYEK